MGGSPRANASERAQFRFGSMNDAMRAAGREVATRRVFIAGDAGLDFLGVMLIRNA